MLYTDSLELEHYGVKGMKWGIRRAPFQLGPRSSPRHAGKKKSDKSVKQDGEFKRRALKNGQNRSRGCCYWTSRLWSL